MTASLQEEFSNSASVVPKRNAATSSTQDIGKQDTHGCGLDDKVILYSIFSFYLDLC